MALARSAGSAKGDLRHDDSKGWELAGQSSRGDARRRRGRHWVVKLMVRLKTVGMGAPSSVAGLNFQRHTTAAA